ncbi:MAG: ABC-type uncharacterized transport system involved in gliding motility auxiliary subunit [Gammaproteobacteria bacterium]|jgi:ABC-type uncharacterized transport system involved in gliding motility auxiliary subunit
MGNRMLSVGGLIIAVVLFLAVNIVSDQTLRSSRLDLTQAQLFTLSAGTREILSTLDEPVTLRFYLSRNLATRLPGVSTYASRVRELLEAYQRESGGNIILENVDPEPFSDEEDRAVAFGLRGIPLDQEAATLYFGLVASGSTVQEQAIPFFSPSRERFLEYDVTRLVYSIVHPKKPVVGLLSTLPITGPSQMERMRGGGAPPWMISEQIKQAFDVLPLERGMTSIPDNVDVLLLVHPKQLPDPMRYAIDQFVMKGGRALVFVDPNAETDSGVDPNMMMRGMMPGAVVRASNPKDLLSSWGISMADDEVVGDLSVAVRVRAEQQGRLVTIDYPMWMNLSENAFSSEDIVTANLGAVTIASPGHLKPIENSGMVFTPLIQTSENAALFPVAKVQNFADPQALLKDYKAAGQRFTLAARVTGPAKSAFADGAPPTESKTADGAAKKVASTTEHLAQSKGNINVVVVADVDMLADQFWVQVQEVMGNRIAVPTAANGPMTLNALDNLTGSSSLIDIRSRGGYLKPFTVVEDLRRAAEVKFREKEQQLIARLEQAEKSLRDLETEKQGTQAPVLSVEQRQELIDFRQERLQIRKELREVRRSLRSDIDLLESKVKFINVAMMPLLIALIGIIVATLRLSRRRRSLLVAGA